MNANWLVPAALLALATPALAQRLAADEGSAAVVASAVQATMLGQPARLKVDNVLLAAGLTELQRSSGAVLAFSPTLLPEQRRVTCHCESVTVGAALEQLLAGTALRYAELGNRILIEPNPRMPPIIPRSPDVGRLRLDFVRSAVAGGSSIEMTAAAPRTLAPGRIRGTIRMAGSALPIANVQVAIPGTGRGALTNDAGEYVIQGVPEGTYTLRARLIGYNPVDQSVTVGDGQTVTANFSLEKSVLALDEVVVTGTAGAARRREVGNTVSQINLATVPEPVSSIDNLLQGRTTGLTVIQNSGQVGGGASIRLRGNVSATMSNQPLIYIDGVRMRSDGYPKNTFPVGYSGNSDNTVYSPLNDIDPSNIERVEIIKGPAATTLYGTEAAAGVIQVFTKHGQAGAARWTFQTDQSLSQVQRFGPTEGFDGRPLSIPANEVDPYGTPGYMYLEPWLRNGYRQKYSLSLSGGREDLQYFLSGASDDTRGVLPLDQGNQFGVRGNLSFMPRKDLTLQWNSNYSHNDIQRTPTGGTAAGITLNAFRRNRNYFGSQDPKVISQVLSFQLNDFIDHLTTGATATYTPFAALTNRLTVGYDLAQQEARGIMPYGFVTTPKGQANDQRWSNRTLTLDYVGTLSFQLFRGLGSDFSAGAQSVTTEETSVTGASQGFPGPGVPTVSSGATSLGLEDRLRVVNAGFFFQNIFKLKDRYFLTAGIRFDGNSAFGSNLGLQAYPKLSGSYIISDEPFWNKSLGTLKLRAAYGQSGRAPGAFDAVRTWNPVSWGGQVSFFPRNLGNPDLGPERTTELEGGLDASIFRNRLTIEFTSYHRTTRDALFNVRQPASEGGWGSQLQNVGKLQSTGLELGLTGTVLDRPRFGWDLGATVSTSHSKTLSLGGTPAFSIGNYGWVVEGQPVPVIRANCVTNPGAIAAPVMARNCNIGPNTPTRTITGNTSVRLPGNINLSARGEYQGGNYAYSLMDGESITRGIRWPSCFNSYPKIDAGNGSQLTAREQAMCIASNASRDLAIFPMDFFRMRDVTLQIPVPFKILRANSAMVSLSAQNFYTWKKAKDSFLDPETSGGFTTGNTGMTEKVHSVGGSIPIPATYVFSLRVTY